MSGGRSSLTSSRCSLRGKAKPGAKSQSLSPQPNPPAKLQVGRPACWRRQRFAPNQWPVTRQANAEHNSSTRPQGQASLRIKYFKPGSSYRAGLFCFWRVGRRGLLIGAWLRPMRHEVSRLGLETSRPRYSRRRASPRSRWRRLAAFSMMPTQRWVLCLRESSH
jgi:hypothetical protein